MSNPTATSVRVTLTGPYATTSQHSSSYPGRISTPSLPQTFELVGRDSNGTPVVKYGFTLKQWFVNRGTEKYTYFDTSSWCSRIGYRVPKVKDLTNAVRIYAPLIPGATPSSPGNHYMRHIGSGFFTEWGRMRDYSGVGFGKRAYWTSDLGSNPNGSEQFSVYTDHGNVYWFYDNNRYFYLYVLCAYP